MMHRNQCLYNKRTVAFSVTFFIILLLLGCSKSNRPNVPPILEPSPCINDLIDKASYEDNDKNALKTGMNATIPNVGGGSFLFDDVQESIIKMQVERSKDNFHVQMALAINMCECIDLKARELMERPEFKALSNEKRGEIIFKNYEVTAKYRTQVIELILANAGKAVPTPQGTAKNVNSKAYRLAVLDAAQSFLFDNIKSSPGLQKVKFKPGERSLSEDQLLILSLNAEYLKEKPELKITLEGEGDSASPNAEETALAEARVIEVKNRLIEKGVKENRIFEMSYGEERPFDPDSMKMGQVKFHISGGQ